MDNQPKYHDSQMRSACSDDMVPRWDALIEGAILLLFPVLLIINIFYQTDQSALILLVGAIAGLVGYFVLFEIRKPTLKEIMPTVVLAAIAAAGRILFAAVPDFKPVAAICIIGGVVFGRRCGFMVGALSMLVSNFFFGQGAFTPWQMYAYGMIGWIAGVLADKGAFKHQSILYAYGAIIPFLYGVLMSSWHIIGFVHPITWQSAGLTYVLGLQMDVIQCVATVIFLAALYAPWRKKLLRIKVKYDLGEQIFFIVN